MRIRQERRLRLGRTLLIVATLCLLMTAPVLADDDDRARGQDRKPKQDDEQPAVTRPAEAQPVLYAPLIATAGNPIDSIVDSINDTEVHWVFVDESKPGAPVPNGAPVEFGAQAPAGETAVRFVVNSSMEAISVQNQDARLHGLRLADLSTLAYCTYLADAPMPYAVMLQLNIAIDVADGNHAWQGRLVYDPAHNGAIVQGEWQCWDTLNGVWWATGGPLADFATPASPQPLAALLDEAPNLGLHPEFGALVLRAGDGWQRFEGYADGVLLGVGERSYLFDFEGPDSSDKEPARELVRNDGDRDSDRRDDRDDDRDDVDNRRFTRLIDLIDFEVKDLCKKDGWRVLGFRNQGQCVSYLNHLAKQPNLLQRLSLGKD